MRSTVVKIAAGAGAVVLAAGVGAATYAALDDSPSSGSPVAVAGSPAAATSGGTVSDVYDGANDSVVEITVTLGSSEVPGGPGGSGASQAQGSGFVYDENGHVVTNAHVVDNATSVKVRLANGNTYDATVVGTDPSTDLAVLAVDAPSSELTPLTLADSSALEVGQEVVAIGSPFGLENTVTSGIVSALDRSMQAPNGYTINGAVQTDAAINHGNSGGPLLDMHGRVIGVNSQIESDSGGSDGVGFAVPSNTVKSIVSQLVDGGSVEHAYLGVGLTEPQGGEAGAQVSEVRSGTPAASAGLRSGDRITSVDGDSVASVQQLQSAIDTRKPGDTVKLGYVRDGTSHTVNVTLGTRPS
ncbi:MAG TPA: trypsin-like peptidase domain-containing protein [Gaiella sp.]|nr:trypsin-like peptidase domain-containing protein [Gaiella sp.]